MAPAKGTLQIEVKATQVRDHMVQRLYVVAIYKSVTTMHNNWLNRNLCNPWSHVYERLVTSSPTTSNQTKGPGRDMLCVYKMHISSSAPPSDNYVCILLNSATPSKAEPLKLQGDPSGW